MPGGPQQTSSYFARLAMMTLTLCACEIADDLRFAADGSGTYRVRIRIQMALGSGLSELRRKAIAEGFELVEEGETAGGRFIVLRKHFKNVSELNDAQGHFSFAVTKTGLLLREYRLRVTLRSVTAGGFRRRFTITVPADGRTTTDGVRGGARVTWECANGGTLDFVAAGIRLPLTACPDRAPAVQRLQSEGVPGTAFCPICGAGNTSTRQQR